MQTELAIQCLPMVERPREEVWRMVDAAIGVIKASGLKYSVGPLETVVQGPIDELLEVAKRAHLAVREAGAGTVFTYIKLLSADRLVPFEEKVRHHGPTAE